MAKSFKFLLSEYIVNEYARLENDVRDAERPLRWGTYCSHDVAHLQLLRCRFECFKEFANNVMILCKITDDDITDYASSELDKKMR